MTEFALIASLTFLPFLFFLGVVASGIAQISQTARKPASWIKPQEQVRTDYGTEAEQRLFGESVKERQLQPLVCLADGTLVCGYRRFHCGTMVGMTEFDVTILTDQLSAAQIKVYRLTENIQRKDLSPWELWQSCAELMCMNPQWQMCDLASHLHFDPSSITRYLSPNKCIEAAQDALRHRKIGISDCYAISKLPEAAQANLLALKLSGATRDEIEAAGRKARNGNNGTASAIRVPKGKFPLPSGVIVQISGADLDLPAVVEYLTDLLKQARKGIDDGIDVRAFMAVLTAKVKDKGKKG